MIEKGTDTYLLGHTVEDSKINHFSLKSCRKKINSNKDTNSRTREVFDKNLDRHPFVHRILYWPGRGSEVWR